MTRPLATETTTAADRTTARNLIVAKISPGAEPDVARIFAESDATDLPHALGVTERSLYSLGDLYVHLVEFDRDAAEVMEIAARQPGFGEISRRLDPFISPYLSTWRGPADASARRFYTWRPGQ
ncbi:TcmI family type II polyketide cyclase [Kineococcus esterisolvens]|uniref:TcmI family type II polyketide cyclase n=1 Tax=unclassified Kineococcus TaxID=2621656 RepID=UPI003D7D00F1